MTHWIEWLLGLERIRLSDDSPLSVRLATPPEAWVQLVGWVLAVFIVVVIYRRDAVKGRVRWGLIAIRLCVIGVVMLLFARPMLVLRRNTVDPSVVAVLIDKSASMDTLDAESALSGSEGVVSRWDAAVASLSGPDGLLAELNKLHHVEVWAFSRDAERIGLAARPDERATLVETLSGLKPDGGRTNVAGSVTTIIDRTQGRRLAGIVVVSDGRQNEPRELEQAVQAATARTVSVQTLAVGSTLPRRDIAITSVWADEHVFLHDPLGVRIQIDAHGYDEPVATTVQLRDQATDELLDSKIIEVGGQLDTVDTEFRYRPERGGRRGLRVVAIPREDEQTAENNAADLMISVHDEKISVMYVEGRPRFEYRCLKDLMVREPSLESSCLLIDADPKFAQEGTRPIRHFPDSIEELLRYDVVVLGDVDPRDPWIDSARLAMLDDFVSVHGGGVAFIAGEWNVPHSLGGTPLSKLLPVRIDPQFYGRYAGVLRESFAPRLTAEGKECRMFRLDHQDLDVETLVEQLPGWFWFASVLGPRPGATVLAEHPSAETALGEPVPLVVVRRYGAGRTCYVGSDDVWRWRRYQGQAIYENFWIQLVRGLARGRRLGGEKPWRLDTDRKSYEFGRKVRVRLRAGEAATADGIEHATVNVTDGQGGLIDRVALTRLGPVARTFEGTFYPRRTGSFVLDVSAPRALKRADIQGRVVTVNSSDPERHRSEADHEFMRMIAARTGGEFHLLGSDPAVVAAMIPDRSVSVPDDIEEPLWDTRLALFTFLLLIVAEWVIRKVKGLA